MNKVLVFALGISVCLSAYVPSGYTVVPNSIGSTNSTIQSALSFAKDKIVGDLAKGNYISGTNFVVSQVNSYAQQNKSTSTNFAFDAVFSNSNDTTISSNFTVSRSKTGVFTVMSYSVTISKTTPVAPNFVDVSPSEVASSQIIQTLRDYGFGQVVVQVQQKYPFIAGPFVVNKTNTVQRQVISDGRVIYKFNVEGHNDDDVKLVAAYAVSYTASTGEKILMASTYVIVDGDTVNDLGELNSGSGYTQVSQTEASSTLTKQIRDFGIQALVDDGVEKGKIPDNTYVVKTTNGVYKQKVSTTVTNYKFDLVLVDNKGTTITAIFIVSYNTQTKAKDMVGFAYNSQKSS